MSSDEQGCRCEFPKCSTCGCAIKTSAQAKREGMVKIKCNSGICSTSDLKKLVYDPLKDIDLSEFKRGCSRICRSYSERLGREFSDELSQCQDSKTAITLFCDKVGLENVDPLIALLELPSICQHDKITKCVDALKRHQEIEQSSPSSIECTANVTCILVPYKGCNFLVDSGDQ